MVEPFTFSKVINHPAGVFFGPLTPHHLYHGMSQKIFRILVGYISEFIPRRVATVSTEDIEGFNGGCVCGWDEFKESAQGIKTNDIFWMLLDDGVNQVKNIFFGFYGAAKSVIHLLSKGIDVFFPNLYSPR
ncbi:MAG: hypothetical protein RLZZ205_1162 [Bacteroidota bacterium]